MASTSHCVAFVSLLLLYYCELCEPRRQCHVKDPHWKGKELKMVHLLFRHGARTPASFYENDPYKNETFYPYGIAELTNEGKREMYKIGKWLKNRYGNFLGEFYQPDFVWAESTFLTRTRMSLELVLAGLFPPKRTPMDWNADLNWQPIPIFSQRSDDDILLGTCPCGRYYEASEQLFTKPIYQNMVKDNQELFVNLTKLTGQTVNSSIEVQTLYSTLISEQEYGLELPKWTKDYFPDRLVPLTKQSFLLHAYTKEQKRIRAGPLIKSFISDWSQKRNGTIMPKNRKIFLYCGHDLTVVNVLSSMNVWKEQMPNYGIMAMFELLRDIKTGEYGIQIYLRNSPNNNAILLTIPGCDQFCPLDKFIELTKDVVPNNLTNICKPKNKNYLHDYSQVSLFDI